MEHLPLQMVASSLSLTDAMSQVEQVICLDFLLLLGKVCLLDLNYLSA